MMLYYYCVLLCIICLYSNRGITSYKINTLSRRTTLTSLSWSNTLADITTNTITTSSSTTTNKIDIKQALFHDLSHIVNLRISVFFPNYKTDVSFHNTILDKIRKRHCAGAVIFMAINNDNPIMKLKGGIVGTIELSGTDFIGTDMQSMGAEKKLYVTDLAVRNDIRREGVGTKLLKKVEEYAANEGYKEIYLHVEIDNGPAMNLYLQNNYNVVPIIDCVTNFAQCRLVKPPDQYIMLSKQIN